MRADRLLALADFLDKLPPEKFKFNIIGVQNGKPMLEALEAGSHPCGTVACAIGWMPAVFPDELEWRFDRYGSATEVNVVDKNDHWNFYAAAEFFEISREDASYLFAPWGGLGERKSEIGGRATPKEVADHIRSFVAEQEAASV